MVAPTPSKVPTGLPETDLFTIEAIPSKGKGLVAQKPIPAGTLLISEPPLFTTATLTNPATFEKDLGAIIRALPKEGQRAFLSLHNNFPGQPNPFSNIVRSNGYPLGPNSDAGGLFPLIARMNHSCRANAQHSWNEGRSAQTVYAVRDIAPGEELTLSYHNGGPSSERRAALKQFFGFDCACEGGCALPAAELAASDARLRQAEVLDERIGDPRRARQQPAEALGFCRELRAVHEAEGVADLRAARLYYDAFQICAMHGDGARAAVFAESARKAREVCQGVDHEEVEALRKLEREPQSFDNWAATKRWASDVGERAAKYPDVKTPVDSASSIWERS
ncbi:hypothetical protein BX600DRAFT_512419 [Xylariales sp. PMI_506]|nr:hypothetical protein BX600DRAFT_512419 [Xylariales sp. PMI_506]